MKKEHKQTQKKKDLHPGSSAEDAKAVGGKGDFGARESDVVERSYTSRNTKRADRGNAQAHSGEDADAARVSGAGGSNVGTGSSSGGDVDTDIVGINPSGQPPLSPDKSDRGQKVQRVKGSTVQLPDESSQGAHGADAAATGDEGDASAGEISTDEASGSNDAGD